MLREIVIFVMVLLALASADNHVRDSVEIRPYRFDDSREYYIPYYMHKKSLSQKMKSVKGRFTNSLLNSRDTLFG